uniref:CSON002177 protein n=1 Tax=Culicoides sonorensis TaxID=179676 RepID=A0A336LS71_CULSO
MNPPRRSVRFLQLPGLSSSSCLSVFILICLETVLLSSLTDGHRIFYMHWNTTNSIFRIDNTDHIIDVNKGNLAYEFDQVHIICPVYEPGTFDNETEKYIIYNVSKVEYETCRITNANPRIIAICDKPQKLMYFTITFRPFSPQPATSSKDDLHRRIGGRCSSHNMKVVFKVCCAEDKDKELQQHNNITSLLANGGTGNANNNMNNNIPDHQQSPSQGQTPTHQSTGVSINTNIAKTKTPSFAQQVPSTSTNQGTNINSGRFIPSINNNSSNIVQSTMNWPQQTSSSSSSSSHNNNNNNNNNNHHQQPFYPSYVTSPHTPLQNSANNYNNNNSPSTSITHKPIKKTNEYDKHPNEVVKNEELTIYINFTSFIIFGVSGEIFV